MVNKQNKTIYNGIGKINIRKQGQQKDGYQLNLLKGHKMGTKG